MSDEKKYDMPSYAQIQMYGAQVKSQIMNAVVVTSPDIPDVAPEMQQTVKVVVMAAACEQILAGVQQLNETLKAELKQSGLTPEEKKESVEWN
jgi:uncharacterized protein YnzC (UPF0291/DUF896 family)